MSKILEGTWEEIKSYDAELAGRTVRLIIDPDDGANDEARLPPNSIESTDQLEEMLLQSLRSAPSTPMTADDWREVRTQGRSLAVRNSISH
jgi:hypothetical protein